MSAPSGHGSRTPPPSRGWLPALAYNLTCGLGALVPGLAGVIAFAYPIGAVLIAAVLLRRRERSDYLEFVLWLWLVGPGIRRVVDLAVGWTPVSPVMAAAPLATLLCLVPALSGRRRVHASTTRAFAVALTAMAYGCVVGVLLNGVPAAAADVLTWLPALALGMYVAAAGPSTSQVRQAVARVAFFGTLVLGAYGIVQFLAPPPWDLYWMQAAPLDTIGSPEPFEVRVFSLLNSPGPFASVVASFMVLLLAGSGRPWRPVVATIGAIALGLSLVRSAWLGLAVGLVVLTLSGRLGTVARVAVVATVPLVALTVVGGPISEAISERVQNSLAAGGSDESFLDRASFYAEAGPASVREVVGIGFGAIGVATKIGSASGELGELGDFDSGILAVLFTFGFPVGLVMLVVTVAAVAGAVRRARTSSQWHVVHAAALVGLGVQTVLGNLLVSVTGVMFWLLLGLLSREEPPRPEELAAAAAGQDRSRPVPHLNGPVAPPRGPPHPTRRATGSSRP